MKVKAQLNAHYKTADYQHVEVNMELEVSESDIPGLDNPGVAPQQKAETIGNYCRFLLQTEWKKLRDEVEHNLIQDVVNIMPPQVEQQLIAQRRIKP